MLAAAIVARKVKPVLETRGFPWGPQTPSWWQVRLDPMEALKSPRTMRTSPGLQPSMASQSSS
jgi:hypothetical protein